MSRVRVVRPFTGVFTICKLCKQLKDDALFKWQNGRRQGLVCVACDLEKKRGIYATDPVEQARAKAQSGQWYRDNPEAHRASTERRRATPEGKEARQREHLKAQDQNNERSRKWVQDNREHHRARCKFYYDNHEQETIETKRRYYLKNKKSIALKNKIWRKENPEANLRLQREYYTALTQRTPPWADLDRIWQFYRDCPVGYAVDHIIPLRGKRVSGFHVFENLQYLTVNENRFKNNKFTLEDGGW